MAWPVWYWIPSFMRSFLSITNLKMKFKIPSERKQWWYCLVYYYWYCLKTFSQGNNEIFSSHSNTGVVINDGKFHQICVTWRNSDGQWKIYKDGDLAKSGTGLKKGYSVHAAGSLTLAQEQDSLGDAFDANQTLQGMLTNVNVWSYTLPASTIKEMSRCCLAGKGDVYEWANFIYGIKGKPHVVTPPGCPCSV
mgnify:CR=1 FL=1